MVYLSVFRHTSSVIFTLFLHDALPISAPVEGESYQVISYAPAAGVSALREAGRIFPSAYLAKRRYASGRRDRKSTRLNSSHSQISYAVFCLKKKKKTIYICHTSM